MATYTPEVEDQMKRFYDPLSEKERRRYAAVEAARLGYGGLEYVCAVFRARCYARGREQPHA